VVKAGLVRPNDADHHEVPHDPGPGPTRWRPG